MGRVAILVMVAVAVSLGLIGGPAPRSVSRAVAAADEPTPPPEALCEAEAPPTAEGTTPTAEGTPTAEATATAEATLTAEATPTVEAPPTWESADVRPPGLYDAGVIPAASLATPTTEQIHRLYLVEIRLPPGGCMPYVATGNQKDGAIVMIVQQGTVEFRWESYGTAIPEAAPVIRGDEQGPGADPPPAYQVPTGTTIRLYPGDWVTLDQQEWFTYRNAGGDTAIILKAVWAVFQIGGCGGGCK